MTFPQQFQFLEDTLPPFAAYYQARKYPRGPWAGPEVIAKRSGLSRRTVTRMGSRISWKGVEVDIMCAFLDACGFQPCGEHGFVALNKLRSYMKSCSTALVPFNHLDQRAWSHLNKTSARYLAFRAKAKATAIKRWTFSDRAKLGVRHLRSRKLNEALKRELRQSHGVEA